MEYFSWDSFQRFETFKQAREVPQNKHVYHYHELKMQSTTCYVFVQADTEEWKLHVKFGIISHPIMVMGNGDRSLFDVMEQNLREDENFTANKMQSIYLGVVSGLKYLHERFLLHAEIKNEYLLNF